MICQIDLASHSPQWYLTTSRCPACWSGLACGQWHHISYAMNMNWTSAWISVTVAQCLCMIGVMLLYRGAFDYGFWIMDLKYETRFVRVTWARNWIWVTAAAYDCCRCAASMCAAMMCSPFCEFWIMAFVKRVGSQANDPEQKDPLNSVMSQCACDIGSAMCCLLGVWYCCVAIAKFVLVGVLAGCSIDWLWLIATLVTAIIHCRWWLIAIFHCRWWFIAILVVIHCRCIAARHLVAFRSTFTRI